MHDAAATPSARARGIECTTPPDDPSARARGIECATPTQALQRLWAAHPWRELRNCPGRYAAPLHDRSPEALLRDVFGDEAPEIADVAAPRPGRDPFVVARLRGGGGLLSYRKAEGRYAHTFNTESGLLRKVAALGVDPSLLYFSGGRDRRAFTSALRVLRFLDDAEQNAPA